MLSINERISLRQLQALIIISSIGTGVIVLPRRAAEYAGNDGWLIPLGLTALAMIIGALVSTAARLRPADTFIQSTGYFLTRPVAYFLGAVLWLKLVLAAGLELRAFMLVVREVLLKHTPMAATGIIMLFVAGYAAIKGIETRARVAELLLCLMVLPFAFLVILAITDIDWSNLQPVFVTPPKTLLLGTLRLGFLFTGMECVLLVSPYIHPKKKMRRAVVAALGCAGLIISLITVLTLASFGRGVVDLPWPVLSMMDMLNLPGAFIERQEALMFSFWIITVFAFINTLLFFGGVLVKDCLGKKKEGSPQRPHGPSRANRLWQVGVLITTVAVFGITCIPWDETEIYQRLDLMYLTVGLFFLVVLPLILILVAKIRGRGNDDGNSISLQQPSGINAKTLLLALGAISLLTLSSCWDKVEIENRAFVVAIGVDKAEEENEDERYTITLSLPAPDDNSDSEEEDPPHIKKASAKTITEAIKIIDAQTDRQLYFGQVKMLVLGNTLLDEPELVRGAIDIFNRHPEIDRALYVLAAQDKSADILTATPPGDALPGRYVAAIFRDKYKIGGTSFTMSLDNLATHMKYSRAAMLPTLAAEDDTLSLSGAALVVNAKKIGHLTEDELRGYLWCFEDGGLGAVVTPVADGLPLPFYVEKHSARVRFHEEGGKLQAIIQVEISGRIEECPSGNNLLERPAYREYVAALIEEAIMDEIMGTATRLQNELKIDGYHWLEHMRKKQYPLYQQYAQHWEEAFTEIEIVPHIIAIVKT